MTFQQVTQEHLRKETMERCHVTLESGAWETSSERDLGLCVSQDR